MRRTGVIILVFLASIGASMNLMSAVPQALGSAGSAGSAKSGSQIHLGSGIISKVDIQAGKINIDHRPIPSMGWPAMSMDFKVPNKNVLVPLKPGQQVRFAFEEDADGQYIITRITPLE